ncbi:MAG: TIGR01777 family oxidoreductase [Chloroflexi bacterium]|nr:TIGR01777 family oxidoreductase [Chloroflexota bacterium]
MKVIVTGGTGMIGRALSRQLLAKHNDVYALTRDLDKYRGKVLNGVQLVKWDTNTGDGWYNLIDNNTAIVNLAGASIAGEHLVPPQRWTEKRKMLIRDSRVEAGAAVVDAIKRSEATPKVVIQISGVGYYGVKNGDEKLSEDHPSGDDFLSGICIAWERSTEAVEELGVRRCVMRTGVVLSMRGGALPPMVFPFKFFAGGPIGDGEQWYSWIHIEDAARAIVHFIENEDTSGVYNVTSPTPVPQHVMAKAIGKAMGRPSFMPTPEPAFKLIFGEMATTILDGQRVVPTRLQDSGFEFEFPTVEQAVDDLINNPDGIRA